MAYPDYWKCPNCDTPVKNSEICTNCTFPKLWHCAKCKKEVHSSSICKNCGYNSFNPEKSKTVIKKSTIITISVFVYLIIIGIVVFFIMTQDKMTNSGELLINNPISFNFWSFSTLDSVTFYITSPSGETQTYTAQNINNNNWVINDISFSEPGNWIIVAEKNGEDDYSNVYKINSECTLDEHCNIYGEDYECYTSSGVCIQHEPDIFDFLDIIMG